MRAILSLVLPVTAFLAALVWRSRRCVADEVTMIRNIGAPQRRSRVALARRQDRRQGKRPGGFSPP